MFNRTTEDKAQRGYNGVSSSDHQFQKCLDWLNWKKSSSVIYVCFGSMAIFSGSQLMEIAKGLESSGHDFIWAVGKRGTEEEDDEGRIQWLGFVGRMEDQRRGLIIEGWAPQVMILEHEAVGGFLTHCGWNSVMEGVAAAVPMVTWPLSAEQFFNEKLVVEILGIGVPVGGGEWASRTEERAVVEGGRVAEAVGRLMGAEGMELRRRVRVLGELGKRAVEEGGSSAMDMRSLIEEIRAYRHQS